MTYTINPAADNAPDEPFHGYRSSGPSPMAALTCQPTRRVTRSAKPTSKLTAPTP
jgi:hypothetical protein